MQHYLPWPTIPVSVQKQPQFAVFSLLTIKSQLLGLVVRHGSIHGCNSLEIGVSPNRSAFWYIRIFPSLTSWFARIGVLVLILDPDPLS